MPYDIEIIRRNQNKTSKWPGGTTTELYIYPKESTYAERDFKWRLSSAKVELEESTFTLLPGINRIIMVIEGELTLEHQGHHSAKLKEFEKDSFSGEWMTTSFGKVIDFNLMMAQGYSGTLEFISAYKGEFKDICLYNNISNGGKLSQITEAFYIVKGEIEMSMNPKNKVSLSEGDLALISRKEKETNLEVVVHSRCQEAKIIKATIFHR